MSRIVVCTAAYEAGRPWIGPYVGGLKRAVSHYGGAIRLILVIDGLEAPEASFRPLLPEVEIEFIRASSVGETPSRVRARMLASARSAEADALVFFDLDDVPGAEALARHLAVLEVADISFGDMRLVDESGRPLGGTFFVGAAVPDRLEMPAAILRRNFLGFSNTAMRREALSEDACDVPAEVMAADWWVYATLLGEGRRARRADGVVVDYRAHEKNMLGVKPDPSPSAVLRRCRIVRAHYAGLRPNPGARRQDAAVARLMEKIEAAPEAMAPHLQSACGKPGVWYEDVARLAEGFLDKATA